MKLSQGEVEDAKTLITHATTSTACLNTSQQKAVDEFYMRKLPEYKALLVEYESDQAHYSRKRMKSLFPTKQEWNPRGRELCFNERLLLCGPPPEITLLKQVEIYMSSKNRWIVYSNVPLHEKRSRAASCYVQVNQDKSKPQFGCIKQLFTNSFAETNTVFATLNTFGPPSCDEESEIWFVSGDITGTVLLPLEEISEPLVIARENESSAIWFLNV